MKINYTIFLFTLVLFFSCKSDDDDNYKPLEIITNPDSVQILQNAVTTIGIFNNDQNIPTQGTLSVSMTQNGSLFVTDPNNTPENPSDDVVTYTPQSNFTGSDSFTYTICNTDQNCKTESVSITINSASSVVFDINAVPYANLSDYNFFQGELKNHIPTFGVIPYEPITPLFTDYAHKKRFIWMPNNTAASYVSDYELLDFPTGTVLLKSFYYDNVQPAGDTKIIETRVMIRKDTGWIFANYIWNDAQTEAVYDLTGGVVNNLQFIDDSGTNRTINYHIPPESDCFTCHKIAGEPSPIGPKPQNMNKDYAFTDQTQNQLQKLVDFGYLESKPDNIDTVVEWDDTTQPLDLRMRSYVDINCAHCHSDLRHCDYRPIRLAFQENDNETNMGVCIDPDEQIPPYTKIIEPGTPARSVLHFRISTNLEQYRMPLIGRTIVHDEGLQLVEDWISSLPGNCL